MDVDRKTNDEGCRLEVVKKNKRLDFVYNNGR